jgi:hypothetical protein
LECTFTKLSRKSVWWFHKKIENGVPIYLSVSLLGIYLKECKSGYNRDICTLLFISALFIIAELRNQPINRLMDEEKVR